MSVIKVTEVRAEEESKKDEVVAGQVRKMPETFMFHETVVLIVDASSYENSEFNEKEPFLPIILEGGREKRVVTGISSGAMSAKRVAEIYPILLDAELTYKEAK